MWPFKKALKDELQGTKSVRVNGRRFVIRKVNPYLDFKPDRMPQVFTYYQQKGKAAPPRMENPAAIARAIEDMKAMVDAGLVSPRPGPATFEIVDLFRWGDLGSKLYLEILAHSLNQFSGLKGVFFSIAIRRSLYSQWRASTAASPLTSSFPMAATA